MKPPLYHPREKAVLDAVHSFEFRRRAGIGGTPERERYPLADFFGHEMSAKDAWQFCAPKLSKSGIAVYAVATINGEDHFASISLAEGHNPWGSLN